MVYGGATDGHEAAVGVRKGLDSGSMMEVVAFPFTFAYYAFEHGLYGCIHIIDFFFFPFYGLAELHPNGPEIKPLDFYHGTWFDKWAQSDKGTDAESPVDVRRSLTEAGADGSWCLRWARRSFVIAEEIEAPNTRGSSSTATPSPAAARDCAVAAHWSHPLLQRPPFAAGARSASSRSL
jgi:hypothetical protein